MEPAGVGLASPMENGKPRQGFNLIESVNHYSYCSNNPVKYTDPSGMRVLLAGITLTGGAGTAITTEAGIGMSKAVNKLEIIKHPAAVFLCDTGICYFCTNGPRT